MTLNSEDLAAMTDEQLRAIESAPAWSGKYGYWDTQAAKQELDRRHFERTTRGVKEGDVIEFVRHGKAPKGGKSHNHRDGFSEAGVSVYLLHGEEVVYVGWWFDIAKRPAYRGRGEVVGFGSDGEPLVRVLESRRDKRFDR